MTRKLTIYPEGDLYQVVEALAEHERRSLNQMTLTLIEEALRERGKLVTGIPHLQTQSVQAPGR